MEANSKKDIHILLFGGTTEGKKAAWLLDQLEIGYYYSTKNKVHFQCEGQAVFGAMDSAVIQAFSRKHHIKLIIDAAHPFAEELHHNIIDAARQLHICTVRYERVFPHLEEDDYLRLFDSFEAMNHALCASKFNCILALTGVQTIKKLANVWQTKACYFRILNTPQSLSVALQSGLKREYIIQEEPNDDESNLHELIERAKAQVILSKESGESGFFAHKLKVANAKKIPLWVVKRPDLKGYDYTVDSVIELHSIIYKLKKTELRPEGITLRKGFTTGSCVTAAAKAAFVSLFEKELPQSISIILPDGSTTRFLTYPEKQDNSHAFCLVVKDAGDDPDIIHGEQVGCRIALIPEPEIKFKRGKGVGLVTLNGLSVNVGEPAINPVPRQMVIKALEFLSEEYDYHGGIEVTPFIPKGEELALKTFNPRIGIEGGISILGTTGRVEPYSNEAFISSIQKQLKVIKALNCNTVVLSSGLRSENILKPKFTDLPSQAFVHFGNLVGKTLELCNQEKITHIHLGLMLGKAIKLAEGNSNTHSKKVVFNAEFAAQIAQDCGYSFKVVKEIQKLKLANAIPDLIPIHKEELFYQELAKRCYLVCEKYVDSNFTFYLLLPGNIVIKH